MPGPVVLQVEGHRPQDDAVAVAEPLRSAGGRHCRRRPCPCRPVVDAVPVSTAVAVARRGVDAAGRLALRPGEPRARRRPATGARGVVPRDVPGPGMAAARAAGCPGVHHPRRRRLLPRLRGSRGPRHRPARTRRLVRRRPLPPGACRGSRSRARPPGCHRPRADATRSSGSAAWRSCCGWSSPPAGRSVMPSPGAPGKRTTWRRIRDEAARVAVTEERARIARELHDVVGHGISVAVLQLVAALGLLDKGELAPARARVVNAERSAREALAEMRRLLGLLDADADSGAGAAAGVEAALPPGRGHRVGRCGDQPQHRGRTGRSARGSGPGRVPDPARGTDQRAEARRHPPPPT